jgi:hypothetical protein
VTEEARKGKFFTLGDMGRFDDKAAAFYRASGLVHWRKAVAHAQQHLAPDKE